MNFKSRRRTGYLFLIPAILIFLIFIAYTVIVTFYDSFHEYRIQTLQAGRKFVGLDQYRKLFADPLFRSSLKFTIQFTVVAVVLETILDKGIMPSEKVLDFPVDCNTLTGSVNL